ncbi:MAG: arginine--tRNA ligase [Bacilli bacterium]|nr:arginine--tRNA ligase [Bacilli bacterium]
MSLIKETEIYLNKIINDLGYIDEKCKIVSSSVPSLGQFQVNIAMSLAKKYHKNPRDIASEIVDKLDNRFTNVNIAGPGFINISFSDETIIEYMNKSLKDFNIHVDKDKSKTIVIDYGNANAAKALHVGHMRSANIGEALKRLAKIYGDKTIGDVHLGDLGRQSGMLISELMIEQPDLVFFDENYQGEYPKVNLTAEDLGRMYPKASIAANEDPKRMEQVRQITKEVEEGRRGFLELWKQMVEISSSEIKKVYKRLNCEFDVWKGEMYSLQFIPNVLEIMKPYLYESDGALVMDIREPDDKKEYPPLIVVKSDGSSKYETRDLATIYDRINCYNPNEIWYVVDDRQSFNFLQVFRGSYKSGLVDKNVKLKHIDFGTINGPDGKPFKTRDGGVMPLEDLIELIKKEITKKVKDNFTKKEKEDIIEKLTIATLKYTDLLPYRKTDYTFDPVKFSSFEGKTGPYILYTLVRCKSILRNNDKIDYKIDIVNDNTRDIYIKIIDLSKELYKAYINTSPNIICEYLFELCNLYNKFYNDINVTNEKDIKLKNNYLTLTKLVSNIISKLLNILAIDEVEKM